MDGLRFDRWTRRRFGLAASGLAAFIIFPLHGAAKKKKKNKKRCTRLGVPCAVARKCCSPLRCDTTGGQSTSQTRLCCKTRGSCRFNADCCSEQFCDGEACRACKVAPAQCTDDFECCAGLFCDGGNCDQLPPSDRALKTNVASVDPADILERVRELPISTWNYTADDPTVRHVGPMAQDFAALFAVGADDRHIHPLDGQGVALAAIKGLLAQIDTLQEENARLATRVAALERRDGAVQ